MEHTVSFVVEDLTLEHEVTGGGAVSDAAIEDALLELSDERKAALFEAAIQADDVEVTAFGRPKDDRTVVEPPELAGTANAIEIKETLDKLSWDAWVSFNGREGTVVRRRSLAADHYCAVEVDADGTAVLLEARIASLYEPAFTAVHEAPECSPADTRGADWRYCGPLESIAAEVDT